MLKVALDAKKNHRCMFGVHGSRIVTSLGLLMGFYTIDEEIWSRHTARFWWFVLQKMEMIRLANEYRAGH